MLVTVQGEEEIHASPVKDHHLSGKKFPNWSIYGLQTKFLRQILHAVRCDHQFLGIAFGLYSHIPVFNKATSEGMSFR